MMSPNELAPSEDQSVLFGIINTSANATTDQNAVYSKAAEEVMLKVPETALTFQLLFPPSVGATIGADGFSGMVVKPWAERDRTVDQILPGVQAEVSKIPGIQVFMTTPPALPGGSNFPVEFLITSTADSKQLLKIANTLQQKAMESGLFAFPPVIDMKLDQPQATITFDRDKLAALGLNLSQVGADLGVATGGNFVNRFNMDGRSYKVIPQIQRDARLNSEQLRNIYVPAENGQMVPLSASLISNTTWLPAH